MIDATRTPATSIENLLEQSSWITDLARRLVRDRDAAAPEDVAQETWVAALQHLPSGKPLRQWLGVVVQNVVRQARRGEARRRTREERAARNEGLPSTAELVERASVQRRVVEAVVELPEPYRTVILLRFFEGMPPREIARRMEVPIDTVQSRLARGLARLRVRLDDEHGGERHAWLLALLPIAGRPPGLLPSALGALLMTAKVKISLVLVAIATVAAVWWATPSSQTPTKASASNAPKAEAGRSTTGTPRSSAPPAEAPLAPAATARTAERPAAAAPAKEVATIRGRVLDCSGNPTAAVAIEYRSKGDDDPALERPRTVSLADGSFTLPAPVAAGKLVAADDTLTTVLAGLVGDRPVTSEIVVVVAQRVEVIGRVVDESSAALAGVEVSIVLPKAFRARFDAILDRSSSVDRRTTSDANGAFELRDAPAVEGAFLRAMLDGFEAHEEPMPAASVTGHVVVLTRPSSADGLVRGRVVDPAAQPVKGARVALGIETTVSSDTGEFAFKLDDPKSVNAQLNHRPRALVAVKRGYLPARYEPPTREGGAAWPGWVTLRLGDKPLAISGRVIDRNEKACGKVWVWIADATMLGAIGQGLTQIESVLAGADGELFHRVATDESGHFTIDGLLDRAYHVQAMDPATLIRVDVGPVDAGKTDLELRLPTDDVYPRVAGRVVTHRGRPVQGAHVFPMCDAFRARFDGQVVSTSHHSLVGVATDVDGRFEMKNVPKSLVYLRVEGPTLIPVEYGRYWDDDPSYANVAVKSLPKDRIESLEIVVDQRCHFQVELADAAMADAVAVLDAAGSELIINVFKGNSREEREHIDIVDGRTPAMAVSDAGRTLVLFKAGAEVARQSIDLEPGALRRLRL